MVDGTDTEQKKDTHIINVMGFNMLMIETAVKKFIMLTTLYE